MLNNIFNILTLNLLLNWNFAYVGWFSTCNQKNSLFVSKFDFEVELLAYNWSEESLLIKT